MSVILPYDGTNASIPESWVRRTSLDGRYPKAWGEQSVNTTGGSATHSHTSPGHSHTLNNHTHSGTSGTPSGTVRSTGFNDTDSSNNTHRHNYTTGSRSGGTTGSTSVTYGEVSNDPPYYEVIFIESSNQAFIPENAMVMSTETTRPGLTFHSESAGRFLKGAGAGQDAGDTGGSTTNVHDITHTHSVNNHSHSGGTTGTQTTAGFEGGGGTTSVASKDHTHSFSVSGSSQPINEYSGSLTTPETVQPAFRTLNAFKASEDTLFQPGDIAMTLSSTPPVGWLPCNGENGTPDMRDRYLKVPSEASSSTTGGSNTHTHASQSHSHTSPSGHNHSVSFGTHSVDGFPWAVGSGHSTMGSHSHNSANSNSTTATYASATTTADEANNEPPYRTVMYIQMQFQIGGGGAIIPKMI